MSVTDEKRLNRSFSIWLTLSGFCLGRKKTTHGPVEASGYDLWRGAVFVFLAGLGGVGGDGFGGVGGEGLGGVGGNGFGGAGGDGAGGVGGDGLGGVGGDGVGGTGSGARFRLGRFGMVPVYFFTVADVSTSDSSSSVGRAGRVFPPPSLLPSIAGQLPPQ